MSELEIGESIESETEKVLETRDQTIIRVSFNEAILKALNPKQNVIETRCITNDQIRQQVVILESKDNPKHYYLRKKYYVVMVDGVKHMAAIKKVSSKESDDSIHRLIVSFEDLWPCLWKIHTSVNYNGRKAMENEANKFFHNHNITRSIIVEFLKFSEQYQIKRRKVINHGFVIKPI